MSETHVWLKPPAAPLTVHHFRCKI